MKIDASPHIEEDDKLFNGHPFQASNVKRQAAIRKIRFVAFVGAAK